MRNETKHERDYGQTEPEPPGALPEMIVDQGRESTDSQSDSEPNSLAFDEKIDVAVTIAGKSAGAEKHDDADHEHDEHGHEHEICAFAMHG